ncbi:MAG TPA: diguanylate cyclase [Longimicrobiales bacterium]|nr:diguanylate cyclase [Longimicrobiales bacterium]
MTRPDTRTRHIPRRAYVASALAILIPVVGALALPDRLGEHGALLWLLPLVPAFLLAYYRGWRGVGTALAVGMAALAITQALASWQLLMVPDMLLGVVIAYLALSMAVGLLAESMHRDRDAVEDMAFTDLLTRLPNRRHADVFLENEFAAAQRGRTLSVVLFDLDGFKRYNDTYGHQAGDEAIRVFADVLARTTRRMNLSARFGGEEYVSVLAGSDSEGAMVFAERVRMAFRAQHVGDPPLTVSAGVATFHPGMSSPDEILAAADQALYQAKREGRNCVRLYVGPASGTLPVPPPVEDEDEDARSLAAASPRKLGEGRRVLLVEDDEEVRTLLTDYLQGEAFQVATAETVREALRELRADFDVVLSDLRLPGATGHEVVSAVKARWPHTQVVVMTGLQDARVAADALNAGADRYLFKPFGTPELRSHLSDALARRDTLLREERERRELTGEARLRATEAREAVVRGARALVLASEVRDPYTRGHSARVAAYSQVLADAVDPEGTLVDRERLRLACELHDVGKIGVPDSVLNKAGSLDDKEMQAVRQHPLVGRRILEPLLDDDLILAVVTWHHERWDGTGYPDRLQGETIPLAARVVAVADTLDAMTCPRAYRDALEWDLAIQHLQSLSGTAFDPGLVETLPEFLSQLEAVHTERPVEYMPSPDAESPSPR